MSERFSRYDKKYRRMFRSEGPMFRTMPPHEYIRYVSRGNRTSTSNRLRRRASRARLARIEDAPDSVWNRLARGWW